MISKYSLHHKSPLNDRRKNMHLLLENFVNHFPLQDDGVQILQRFHFTATTESMFKIACLQSLSNTQSFLTF